MEVFKFGGASVKNSAAVQNAAEIIQHQKNGELIVVVSAMGKITNLLESILAATSDSERNTFLNDYITFHTEIADELGIASEVEEFMKECSTTILNTCQNREIDTYHKYDEVVARGELLSTFMLHKYLLHRGIENTWLDARKVIQTQPEHKVTNVDWVATQSNFQNLKSDLEGLIITQGFISGNKDGETTTLGREGSDFSAAIFAYLSGADSVTIWKDVPGMLNADPNKYEHTVKLNRISYREAIELSYYGASVIHPKTIKPLENKKIPLFVKSFVQPEEEGTLITEGIDLEPEVACYINKSNQVLVSFTPKDLSFVQEKELSQIFGFLAAECITIHLMQNSAVSFSIVFNQEDFNFGKFEEELSSDFNIKYNLDLTLLTVRHYTEETLEQLTAGKDIYIEQRSRSTIRLVHN